MIIGNTAHLAFDITWPKDDPTGVAGLGWGALRLWVGGRLAWTAGGNEDILWTWIDLVEHLARAWGHLCFEENAPLGLVTYGPEHLRDPRVLRSVPGVDVGTVEEAVHAYQHRHDLAAGLKGISLPPVWVLPVGHEMRVRFDRRDVFAPRTEVLATLVAFAEAVIERTSDAPAPRTQAAIARWNRREPTREKLVGWRSALPLETLKAWTPEGAEPSAWWDMDGEDSSMMAAARLSEGLDEETRRALVRALAQVPACATPHLDHLCADARPVVDMVAGRKPYEQGHDLALWLRSKLRIGDVRVEPLDVLRSWGVHVADLPKLQPELDAVACWGGGKGPAVLVNPYGKHANAEAGRRSTLAHEIAHLLLDRGHQLPAAEVFGGTTPLHLEQRARAFAAEFLLPRDVAAGELARTPDLFEVLHSLSRDFGVSREIVGWQIKNGQGWELLGTSDRRRVSQWAGLGFDAVW